MLLLFCVTVRVIYVTRVLSHERSSEYARQHDAGLWRCLCRILHVDELDTGTWRDLTQLPFSAGGLGLRSAVRLTPAASWASWADSLSMIRTRHPDLAAQIVTSLEEGGNDSDVL